MIFSKPPLLGKPEHVKRPRIHIEGHWPDIEEWVEELRRDGWKEVIPVTGLLTDFKATSVEFER